MRRNGPLGRLPGSPAMRGLAGLILGLVAYLSLTPQLTAPASAPAHADWLVHLVMHGAIGITLRLGWPASPGWVAVGLITLGVGFEVAQAFIPGRCYDMADLVMNLIGAASGAGVAWALLRRIRPVTRA